MAGIAFFTFSLKQIICVSITAESFGRVGTAGERRER